jgi:hypothetical protein
VAAQAETLLLVAEAGLLVVHLTKQAVTAVLQAVVKAGAAEVLLATAELAARGAVATIPLALTLPVRAAGAAVVVVASPS